jgi:hypothetical protein
MSLEDRVRSTVDQAIGSLVQQLVAQATEERDAASRAAVASALEQAEVSTQVRVVDAEARVRALMEEAIQMGRREERDLVSREVRQKVEAELEPKLNEAVALAEARSRVVLAEAQAKAADDLKAAVASARVKEREIELAGVNRLLDSVRGLDGASTLSEVLDALALAAGREAARAAVVVLRGERIHGWKLTGFGPRDTQPKLIDLPLSESGVIALAVGAARAVTTRDSSTASTGPGFESLSTDRMGLAVPVVVGGRVVAVVYADAVTLDGHDRPVPSCWPELIEVLARHAGRCLEALTTQKTQTPKILASGASGASSASGAKRATAASSAPDAPVARDARDAPDALGAPATSITDGVAASARRTARLLISEIRLYHEPAVNEGRQHRNLLSRLAPEIEKARLAYDERVPAGVRGHTDFFHQELIRTLAGGDATLLGNAI